MTTQAEEIKRTLEKVLVILTNDRIGQMDGKLTLFDNRHWLYVRPDNNSGAMLMIHRRRYPMGSYSASLVKQVSLVSMRDAVEALLVQLETYFSDMTFAFKPEELREALNGLEEGELIKAIDAKMAANNVSLYRPFRRPRPDVRPPMRKNPTLATFLARFEVPDPLPMHETS